MPNEEKFPPRRKSPYSRTLATLATLAKVRLLGGRAPLFLEWNLTFRCNLRCQYCGACDANTPELDAPEIIARLGELWAIGGRWITFGGGEPLLKKGIEDIVRAAKELGFQVFLSTNGTLLPEKAAVLQWVDHVNLSLDGGREVHDAVRGPGAYDKTIAAIAVCRRAGVDVSLQCVLSSLNLEHVDEVLAVASEYGVPAMFQPATQWLDSSMAPNPIAPPVEAYRWAIAGLIHRKRRGAPIRNSVAGLIHLGQWPHPTRIWCSGGLLTCTVEPDGSMLACHQAQVAKFLAGKTSTGPMADQFAGLARPRNCLQCWCAPVVELALIFSLRPGPIWNALRSQL
jgi:MoaA/NifB/PqqE/SkfB family radical SAM enzyme